LVLLFTYLNDTRSYEHKVAKRSLVLKRSSEILDQLRYSQHLKQGYTRGVFYSFYQFNTKIPFPSYAENIHLEGITFYLQTFNVKPYELSILPSLTLVLYKIFV